MQKTSEPSVPWAPVIRYWRRNSGRLSFRNLQEVRPPYPLVSFTFDDFPRSALLAGGRILKQYGAQGTYYVALGLLGKDSPSGPICQLEDVELALKEGHELGCHTFAHCDSWWTDAKEYEQSILNNRQALRQNFPEAHFETFSFPLSSPHPSVKRAASRHFSGCRGGGQTINSGKADLNQLSAYFIEKANGDLDTLKVMIDRNKKEQGWLIFATHDVAPDSSPYGCTPELFEETVRYAASSGARILPVASALQVIKGHDSQAN